MYLAMFLLGLALGICGTARWYRRRMIRILEEIHNGMVLIIPRKGPAGVLDLRPGTGAVLRPSMMEEHSRWGTVTHDPGN